MIHHLLKLAKAIVRAKKAGTPLHVQQGVVESSLIGQSQVSLDGGRTSVPAFNCDHTKLLAAGTIVLVVVVGNKAHIIGQNPAS